MLFRRETGGDWWRLERRWLRNRLGGVAAGVHDSSDCCTARRNEPNKQKGPLLLVSRQGFMHGKKKSCVITINLVQFGGKTLFLPLLPCPD